MNSIKYGLGPAKAVNIGQPNPVLATGSGIVISHRPFMAVSNPKSTQNTVDLVLKEYLIL